MQYASERLTDVINTDPTSLGSLDRQYLKDLKAAVKAGWDESINKGDAMEKFYYHQLHMQEFSGFIDQQNDDYERYGVLHGPIINTCFRGVLMMNANWVNAYRVGGHYVIRVGDIFTD